MATITGLNTNLTTPPSQSPAESSRGTNVLGRLRNPSGNNVDVLRETFTQFVGETFYGQMIKAMRCSVGKPAYFHGGRAEEVFRGQLDQALAEQMTAASADRFAEPMFQQQFPQLATAPPSDNATSDLNQLNQLTRR